MTCSRGLLVTDRSRLGGRCGPSMGTTGLYSFIGGPSLPGHLWSI